MRDYNSIMRMQGHFICTRAGRGIFNRAHIAGHFILPAYIAGHFPRRIGAFLGDNRGF